MSLLLAKCSARNGHPPLAVYLASTADDLDAVWRLRHRIYVEELGIVPPNHPYVDQGRLKDPYDDHSHNLLLRADGVPAGTVRLTEAIRGPLEIDRYTDASVRSPDPRRSAEVTRLMVAKTLRGSPASALLLYGMWRVMRQRQRYLLVAAKPGGLGRYYKRACAVGMTVYPERFEYGLTGCQYELVVADTGEPLSPQRLAWRAWIRALALLSFQAPPVGLDFVRNRRTLAPST